MNNIRNVTEAYQKVINAIFFLMKHAYENVKM